MILVSLGDYMVVFWCLTAGVSDEGFTQTSSIYINNFNNNLKMMSYVSQRKTDQSWTKMQSFSYETCKLINFLLCTGVLVVNTYQQEPFFAFIFNKLVCHLFIFGMFEALTNDMLYILHDSHVAVPRDKSSESLSLKKG